MLAIGFAIALAGYAVGFKGFSLLQGWDLPFTQMINPLHWYQGPWPPPHIPDTQVLATKGGPAPAKKGK